jgi:eukaryotic-like serine/threonine-protein kinase
MIATDQPPQAASDADTRVAAGTHSADSLLYPRPGILAGGRYRLLERIGRGASAEVWRSWDLRLTRLVAIKIFREGADGDIAARARRGAEARLVASLNHRHLVSVYDAAGLDGDGEIGWIAMELVDGHTLRDVIALGPLNPSAVAAIGCQLADALDYVHRRGAVHRDVKPANVLLTADPDQLPGRVPDSAGERCEPFVKLTDFGVARLLDDTRLTVEGFTIGTANYLSPEQVTGNSCGPEVDVYALGLVLLEALTGRVAYPGTGAEAALARLHRPPDMPAWLSPHWRALLTAMTAQAPEARPDLATVRAALSAIRAGSPLFGAPIVPPPRSRRRRRILLVGAAAALAAIAVPIALGVNAHPPNAAAATVPSRGKTTRSSGTAGNPRIRVGRPTTSAATTSGERHHHRGARSVHVVETRLTRTAKRPAARTNEHPATGLRPVVRHSPVRLPTPPRRGPASHAPHPPRPRPEWKHGPHAPAHAAPKPGHPPKGRPHRP